MLLTVPSWLFSLPGALSAAVALPGALWVARARILRWVVIANTSELRAAREAAQQAQQAATLATATSSQWRELATALQDRVQLLEGQLADLTRQVNELRDRENFAQKHIRWLVNRVRQLEEALRASGGTPPPPSEPEPF